MIYKFMIFLAVSVLALLGLQTAQDGEPRLLQWTTAVILTGLTSYYLWVALREPEGRD
jgi:hypothetical protein